MAEYTAMSFWAIGTEEAPIDKGTLRGSIQLEQISALSYSIGTDLDYAVPVHGGHLTRPSKSAGALTHQGKSVGNVSQGQHFVEGNPFFLRTMDTVEGNLEDYLDEAMEGI